MDKDLQPSNYIFLCSQCNEVPLCHLISPTEISFRCSCSHKEIQLENVFNYFSFAREVPQICPITTVNFTATARPVTAIAAINVLRLIQPIR